MSASSSVIREKSLIVFQKLDKIATKYIQHNSIKYFVERFLRPRMENMIKHTIPESELKTALTEAFYEIKPIIEDYTIAHQLKEARKINPIEVSNKLEKLPDFKKYEDLIADVM